MSFFGFKYGNYFGFETRTSAHIQAHAFTCAIYIYTHVSIIWTACATPTTIWRSLVLCQPFYQYYSSSCYYYYYYSNCSNSCHCRCWPFAFFFGDTRGLAGSPYMIHVGGVTGRGDKDLAAAEMKLHKEGMDWSTVFERLFWMQNISRKVTYSKTLR